MPTIDELAPATSASDSDEFIVSQAGIARRITRSQVLNGLQPQIALPSGVLLGRISSGTGGPEVIGLGQNLVLNGNTLSATATPFIINGLPGGYVPSTNDLIAMSQSGGNVAVTYGQLLSGIAAIPNIDVSQTIVTPTGASNPQSLADLTANMLQVSGGTVCGPLGLAGSPLSANQAANKAYVDQQAGKALQLSGGSMSGILTLAAAPQNPMDSATKSYVDSAVTSSLSLNGGSLTGFLLLNADPTNPIQAVTKRYADQKISRTGDTLTGPLTLASDPVVNLQAATKSYVDVQTSRYVAKAGDTLLGMLTLASDPVLNAQAATKQYVDQRVLRTGDTLTGMLGLAADPTMPNQAVTKNYVDSQFGSLIARSGSSMIGPLLLASDPTSALQASTKQYVDLRLARTGDSLTGALYLAADPTAPSQASTKQYVDNQFATAFTKAGGTFTGPIVLAADPSAPAQAATKQYVDSRLLRTGDTLTGALMLAADPVTSVQAATKNYVDRQVTTCLPLSGGSITGTLSLGASPALANHAATKQYVDTQLLTTLSLTGGTLTGGLTLAAAPLLPMQAATKLYVDANPNSVRVLNVTLPPFGAKLDGVTDDTPAFKAAYQAVPTGGVIYVPNGTTVLQQPNSWGVPLTKVVKWIVDGTVLAGGASLAAAIPAGGAPGSLVLPGIVTGHSASSLTTSQGASQPSDFAVAQSSYIVNHAGGIAGTVATNTRSDTIIYASPGNYVWGGLDRLLWAGTQTPSAATPAQHVARYIQTFRQAATTGSGGQALPQPQLWAACLEYRDTTGQPSSATNASLTVEMDWFGNGLDDANTRRIQSLVIGQHDKAGSPVEVSNVVGVFLAGGSAGSAKTVFAVGVPFSNAVLDTTYAQQINNAPAIKLAAGQAIAFDSTGNNRLLFDAVTNTLRWNQGALSYAVGKGISVGWVNVISASQSLPGYLSGNLIILNGASPYSITLPAASAVAAGTGFTFSVIGNGPVTITPTGADVMDCGPIILRANDRYHIVSDGSSSWREIFRTNAVAPRFSAPPVLPSYTVSTLPSSTAAGAKAFVSNGRKPNEAAGSGSGVEVCFDGQRWISSCSGAAVTA